MKITLLKDDKMSFKGDVVIMDPCYIFDHSIPELSTAWDDISSKMFNEAGEVDPHYEHQGYMTFKDLERRGIIDIDGMKILYTATANGDGTYAGASCDGISNDQLIGVDSGSICVALVDDVKKINPGMILSDYMCVTGFEGHVISTGAGFTGSISVDTDYEDTDSEDTWSREDTDDDWSEEDIDVDDWSDVEDIDE